MVVFNNSIYFAIFTIFYHLAYSIQSSLVYFKYPETRESYLFQVSRGSHHCLSFHQCSQNVDVNGPHHRCFELIVSSSFNQPMAVERGRSHELVGSMVGAVYVHVLRTLVAIPTECTCPPTLLTSSERSQERHVTGK